MTQSQHSTYTEIPESELPAGLRWDTPRRNEGQIVEVSYADERPYPSPADYCRDRRVCAPYRRTIDHSTGEVIYARLGMTAADFADMSANDVAARLCPDGDAAVPGIEVDQDWEHEATIITFSDGTRLRLSGTDVEVAS